MELEQSKKEFNITERTLGSFGLFEGDLLKGLSMSLQMTYTYLLYHYNHKTKKCCPSIRRLAKEMGCNKETVSIAIEKLQSIGLIIKHHIHGKKSSYDLPFVRIKLYGNRVQLEENCTEIVPTSNTNCTEIVPTTVRKSGTVYPQTVRKSCPEQDVYKDEINKIKEKEIYKSNFGNHDASELSYIQLVDYWVKAFNIPPDSNLRDSTRMKLSKAALRQYGLPGCIEAINGCKLSEWYLSKNQTDLAHIFKDATTIEGHKKRKVWEPLEKIKQSKLINPYEAYGNKYYKETKNESK